MPNKFTISVDLMAPGQKYDKAKEGVFALGPAVKVLYSQWEVQTSLTYDQVYAHMLRYIDKNDRVYVGEVINSIVTPDSVQALKRLLLTQKSPPAAPPATAIANSVRNAALAEALRRYAPAPNRLFSAANALTESPARYGISLPNSLFPKR